MGEIGFESPNWPVQDTRHGIHVPNCDHCQFEYVQHATIAVCSQAICDGPYQCNKCHRNLHHIWCQLFMQYFFRSWTFLPKRQVLNAANYFIAHHNGWVPSNITVQDLSTLHGVSYKTANMIVTTAFDRVDGIPSDIHVLQRAFILGWASSSDDSLKCSKEIEQWLPKRHWHSVNIIFRSFHQMLSSLRAREPEKDCLFSELLWYGDKTILCLFMRVVKKSYYTK